MLYLITYSISKNKDYTALYDAIKSYDTWWHYIDSTWIVKTTDSVETIAEKLNPLIDSVNNSLLVVKIDPSERQGWLPKKAWDWIRNNSKSQ